MLCFEKYCFGVHSWLLKDYLKTTFQSGELWIYFMPSKDHSPMYNCSEVTEIF